MTRAAQKQTAASASLPESALALHRSPAQERLEALRQEHERLLRDITKKRAAREVVEQQARDAASDLASKLGPLRDAYATTLRALKTLFDGLLGEQSHLNRRDRARVRRFYARILPDLASEPPSDDTAPEDREESEGHHAPRHARHAFDDDESEVGYSATKPDEKKDGLLRALFRKLAIALHPDKVQDAKERETLTSVMKEVTRAYESGDVARLVEIERTWLAQTPLPERELDVTRRITELLSANKELRRQLRALTAELKEIKQSVPGMSAPRRRGRASPAHSEVDQMIGQIERELGDLRALREFTQRFADGDMSVTEFLLGPELAHDENDPFEQMLAEVLDAMADAPRQRGRRRQKR